MKLETIRIVYVEPKITSLDEGYVVQFAGFTDKKLNDIGRLRTWSMPFKTAHEANAKLADISKAKIIFNSK